MIVFPTVFAVLSWMFLEWRFSGTVFNTVAADPAVLAFRAGVWPVPASVVAVWIGLRYTPVTAYVLFTLVALLSVPRDTSRRTCVVIAAVALAQLVLAWVWPPTSPGFTDWLAAVTPV